MVKLLQRRKLNKKGFTLIELLIVLVVIGILGAIAIPLYTQSVKSAYIKELKMNMAVIKTAAAQYYVTNGNFTGAPTGLNTYDANIAASATPTIGNFTYTLSSTAATAFKVRATATTGSVLLSAYADTTAAADGSTDICSQLGTATCP